MKPNYAVWDTIDEFTDEQAAWLWIDEEPRLGMNERTAAVLAVMNQISQAVDAGVIRAGTSGGVEHYEHRGRWDAFIGGPRTIGVYSWPKTHVKRDELLKFAEQRRAKPPFLFPEERAGADSRRNRKESDDSERKTDNLRKIIALAALALIEKTKGGRLGTEDKPNVSQIAELLIGQIDRIGIDRANIQGTGDSTIRAEIKAGMKLLGVE
jgi:hypothetical protein